ncbi:hypothetical protein FF36_03362 [Frankia torreyi]|uniref:Uncharacterized protein n=1 Tax=Frankia torreyi TaxID=1856 RepID=A0A0D8BDG0_9ACTN|nr:MULTISPECIES: hypothetical protein [Frankia]KJE22293.1 hypothetical protein FF36_03362 [Frankia torreyi]KQC37941.1 hypothetical protein UK82_13230 [Frankia sp. ACN1ag]KQM05089.1 hypothetical protein FF86_101939 [Frankia sp. CpI1-P]
MVVDRLVAADRVAVDRLIAGREATALAMAGHAMGVAARKSRTDGVAGMDGVAGVDAGVGACSRTDAARPVVQAWSPDRRLGPRAIAIDYSP